MLRLPACLAIESFLMLFLSAFTLMMAKAAKDWAMAVNFMIDDSEGFVVVTYESGIGRCLNYESKPSCC